jgi:hypothetical protein
MQRAGMMPWPRKCSKTRAHAVCCAPLNRSPMMNSQRLSNRRNCSPKNITPRNMNNKTSISSFARAKEFLVSLRRKYGIKNRYSMTEIAERAGLPVEYLENIPKNCDGFLDWHDDPRFIAVNRNLPAHEQVLFIARQLATCAQKQRRNSLALDRPWKWEMFDAAPAALKQKISQMDIEYRAHWLMMFFSTGDEFRAFMKANPKRFWSHIATDNVVLYHLLVLRAKLWFSKFSRKVAIIAFPAS